MQSLADAFSLASSAQLQWVHGVNTPERLDSACANQSVHVLAADVYFEAADATPLLKNAPGANTELDLATFITKANQAHKAMKLEFHSTAAIEPTLALLSLLSPALPPILHAKVFTLLAPKIPHESLEPEQFVRLISTQLPQAIISLGWSLKRESDRDGRVEDALILQLASMLTSRLGPSAYGLEIRAGYHRTRNGKTGERGAALILDPLEPPSPADSHIAADSNVVSLLPRLRRVA